LCRSYGAPDNARFRLLPTCHAHGVEIDQAHEAGSKLKGSGENRTLLHL